MYSSGEARYSPGEANKHPGKARCDNCPGKARNYPGEPSNCHFEASNCPGEATKNPGETSNHPSCSWDGMDDTSPITTSPSPRVRTDEESPTGSSLTNQGFCRNCNQYKCYNSTEFSNSIHFPILSMKYNSLDTQPLMTRYLSNLLKCWLQLGSYSKSTKVQEPI